MEIELIIQEKKGFYSSLMEFIDTNENIEIESLIKDFEKQENFKSKEVIISTLRLISKIADNHHRLPDFFDKLGKIIQYLIQGIRFQITNFEIYHIFRNSKRVLLLLLEQRFIRPDQNIISDIMTRNDTNDFPYKHYLYAGIKSFINENISKAIECKIKQKYHIEINDFERKCRIGENDSYICSLIRQDLVEEFISYANRSNISLSSLIQPSIYETNSFLMKKKVTLMKYAMFFGSIQIIQYLHFNNISLKNSLWIYAIHSDRAELIHFLEENEIKPKTDNQSNKFKNNQYQNDGKQCVTYGRIYEESIKCHHNNIADYIKDHFLDPSQNSRFESCIIDSYNYHYFPTDVGYIISKNTLKEDGFNIKSLCFSTKQITIPSSVTSIGSYAFCGCSSLIKITIPSSVTSIGEYAFNGCSSLNQIVIPSSVTSIGENAFNGIKSLEIDGNIQNIIERMFRGCKTLEQLTITSFITSIGNSAFRECSSLKRIRIPSSVTSIGNFAFSGCYSLREITIPISVTSIGNNAFRECSSLTQIAIPSHVTSIENNTFRGCSTLKRITIPSSLVSIGNFAFNGCSSLIQIAIPSSVTSIGGGAFKGCTSLVTEGISNKKV